MASRAALERYPQRYRQKAQPAPLFPLLAVCTAALLWLPSLFAVGDTSLAFLIPFMVIAWALLSPGSGRRSTSAIRGEFSRGLWIEIGCVWVALLFAVLSMIHSPAPERAFRVIVPMA